MTTEERVIKQREVVEQFGRHFDKEGFQPIAGRILGLLLVMDKELYTFDEIIDELQISKSSASNALRNLEIRGDIEYITLPGDRKRYFRFRKQNAGAIIEVMEKKLNNLRELTGTILELKADQQSENAIYLQDMQRSLCVFLESIAESKLKLQQKD
jgi:DNA-binding transcriptional regulator GbsR (MarR family)